MMFMDAKSELNLDNPDYQRALELYVWRAFKQDMPDIDITTRSFLGRASMVIQAKITAKQEGVLAGMQEAAWFLSRMDIHVKEARNDGDYLKEGDVILQLEGRASSVLAAERTLLNLLQRMSGVATKTRSFVAELPSHIKLLSTRKTLWGNLDKRAVAVGGGGTHRLTLSDAILVKENHIALSASFKKSLKAVFKKASKLRFVEVELESQVQVNEFLELYASLKKYLDEQRNVVVMLDNFSPDEVKMALPSLREAGLSVELSGGICLENIHAYALDGVSAISSGAITMSAPHLDLSLSILNSND